MKHRVVSAKTERPNDDLTDRRPKVWHIVTVVLHYSQADDGREGKETIHVRHYSSDPSTALDELARMSAQEVSGLMRAED